MKDKITTFLFIGYLVFFSLLGIILEDKEISSTERRKLTKFPEVELSNEYISKVDKYLLDHFPFRDEFRSIKANYNYKLLNKLDNNGIYLKDDYIFKSIYPTNTDSVEKFIEHVKTMSTLFDNSNIYTMIVPDKNYYLDGDLLNIDYDYIYNEVKKVGNFIDIRNTLELEDYYMTDTHWKQEKLLKVIKEMDKSMDFKYHDVFYEEKTFDNFYGVYYGESAIDRKPEKLTYLTSPEFDNVRVDYLENSKLHTIYNEENLKGLDAYNVYLDGASSFIEIYNDSVDGKNLVVFRDSFGSSLVPLLVPYYSKITVVDNRYIGSNYFEDLIDKENTDVLFLYSTLLVNESGSIKN